MFFKDPCLEPFVPYPYQGVLTPRPSARTTCPRSISENFLHRMDTELGMALQVLQRFCSEANLVTHSHSALPPQKIQDTMTSIMYRLLHMTSFPTGSIDEAISLGLLAFCDHLFLQSRYFSVTYPHFSSVYRNCLDGLKTTDEIASRMMLWLLMIGAITIFTTNITWLKECLREHIDLCQVKSWAEMRDILRSFLWIDIFHDTPGKAIFDSIYASEQFYPICGHASL